MVTALTSREELVRPMRCVLSDSLDKQRGVGEALALLSDCLDMQRGAGVALALPLSAYLSGCLLSRSRRRVCDKQEGLA